MNNLIATVAVEKTFFSTDSDFDYIIPVSLINNVKIGSMVKVPFGNGNKLRCAIVVNIYSAINSALKEIDSIIGDWAAFTKALERAQANIDLGNCRRVGVNRRG